MKAVVLISLVLLTAAQVSAQPIAGNEVPAIVASAPVAVPPVSGALEHASYRVSFFQNGKNCSFEVYSPKSEKAEVKLVTVGGDDICVIHKGSLREGKNIFTLPSKKISKGVYYVVSKLAGGEQFAEKVVVAK